MRYFQEIINFQKKSWKLHFEGKHKNAFFENSLFEVIFEIYSLFEVIFEIYSTIWGYNGPFLGIPISWPNSVNAPLGHFWPNLVFSKMRKNDSRMILFYISKWSHCIATKIYFTWWQVVRCGSSRFRIYTKYWKY